MYGDSKYKYVMTAVVCENGHLISGNWSEFRLNPKKYCPECGAKLITSCPNCNAFIPGDIYVEHDSGYEEDAPSMLCIHRATQDDIPAYCGECGKPYPWTENSLGTSQKREIGF